MKRCIANDAATMHVAVPGSSLSASPAGAPRQVQITRTASYGVFVNVGRPAVSALVHVSELDLDYIPSVFDKFHEGDLIDVKVWPVLGGMSS